MILSIFSYVSGPSICPPWRSVCSGPLPIFHWVVCLPKMESCEFLYILEIKPLSKVSLVNKFSHMVGSLFILLMLSLAVQKLYNLKNSHLFILCFMSLALGDILVKILLHGIYELFLPVFSSRTSIVLWLIFKSFIYLKFIFVYGISWWLSFIFCLELSRSPNTICWRGYFYSILCFCLLCQKLIDHRDMVLFLGSLFYSIGLCLLLCQHQTVLITVAF